MTRNRITITTIALITLLSAHTALLAEQAVRYQAAVDGSNVRVDGTSTVHDWTVTSPHIGGHIDFQVDLPKDAPPQQVKRAILANPKATAHVAILARSLKSDKADMDKKMYEALRTEKHPLITYQLTELSVTSDDGDGNATFQLATKGELTVAGKTRILEMPMTVEVLDETQLKITGRTPLRMTDFGVKPPQAMLGMIKSGDKINVRVEWLLKRSEDVSAAAAE